MFICIHNMYIHVCIYIYIYIHSPPPAWTLAHGVAIRLCPSLPPKIRRLRVFQAFSAPGAEATSEVVVLRALGFPMFSKTARNLTTTPKGKQLRMKLRKLLFARGYSNILGSQPCTWQGNGWRSHCSVCGRGVHATAHIEIASCDALAPRANLL